MSIEEHHPYKLTWLDSCHQDTLLPGSPWSKVRDALNERLASKVRAFCRTSEKEAVISLFSLLGQKFVLEYMCDEAYSKQLAPVLLSTSDNPNPEMQQWLQRAITDVTAELGFYLKEGADTDTTNVSRDMLDFARFAQQVVHRGLQYKMDAVQRKTLQTSKLSLLGSSYQSATIGNAVSALLEHHPSQLGRICQQLYGRQLPHSLRQLIWTMRLHNADVGSDIITSPQDFETQLQKAKTLFESSLSWGLKELNLSSPAHSPIEGLLKHAVTEAYNFRPGLQCELVLEAHAEQAVKVLNMMYVHSRNYEPHYALLAYPLICAFNDDHLKTGDLSQELTLSLHLLLKNCFPSRLQIFSMADHVIERLNHEDLELYNHLVDSMQKNVSLDAREFLVNFIHTEKEKAMVLEKQETGGSFDSLPSDAKKLLCHPIVFIRKWIVEGFVGVLGVHAMMLVWDQCFMSGWKSTVMENTCLVILQLLRDKIMTANGYPAIRKVLLDQPCELFTIDIQQGLSYLGNGGALQDVGSLRQPTQLPSLSEDEEVEQRFTPSIQLHDSPVTRPRSRHLAAGVLSHKGLVELWVERTSVVPLAELPTNHDSFDIYIDEVRFIPDNATVVKVTGRVLGPFWEKPANLDIPDIEAYPLLDSPARCPKFKYRYTVNVVPEGITSEAMLLLRTYTIDVNSGELIVIGNSIISLFREDRNEFYLNTGGYQLPLKHILPSTVSKLTEEAFDSIVKVPVSSILMRLLPHSEDFVDSPAYSSGYYLSEACRPNQSELRIFQRYQNHSVYPPTVREALQDIKQGENAEDEQGVIPTSDQSALQYYKRRTSKHALKGQPAKATDLTKVVQYDQKQGLSLTVEQAHGLPNPAFVNALVHVSSGPKARSEGETEEGYGGNEKALFKQHNLNSFQKSPKWMDPPVVFRPTFDEITSLVIRLYSLDAVYRPRIDRAGPGAVESRKGRNLLLEPLGWTVLPLFSKLKYAIFITSRLV